MERPAELLASRRNGVIHYGTVTTSCAHMVAIYAVWYNWIRIHKSLRITPAMASGLTDKLATWEDFAEMMDADQPTEKRGPYKKVEAA